MLHTTSPLSIWLSIYTRQRVGALYIGVRNLSIHPPRCLTTLWTLMTPFQSFLHRRIFNNWLLMLMQHMPKNCIIVALRRATMDVAWPVVLWLIDLADNLSVRRAPWKLNLSPWMLPQKLPTICIIFFMNWDTLKLSLLLSTKTTTLQ